MILMGQYDSPFVRRVGISLRRYALPYEHRPSGPWVERCKRQIADTLDVLEGERAARSSTYWLGDTLTHADIAFACGLRFTREAHPDIFDAARFPRLASQAARCEELEDFRAIVLPITNNL